MSCAMVLKHHHILALCTMIVAPQVQAEITVFAAASLKTALDDVIETYEAETGEEVLASYAGSSALTRHIQYGAPADLVILANVAWMDVLEQGGELKPETRVDLLGNQLALIGHGAVAPFDLSELPEHLGDARLAMALVNAVPAGIYGKAALTSLALWDELAPQVAQTDNVRAALSLVALGEAPFGITYVTDAAAEPRVIIAALFPETSHPPIRYPAALTRGADDAAVGFLAYLQSETARLTFASHGFVPLLP